MTLSLSSQTHNPRLRTPLKLQLQAAARVRLAEAGLLTSPFAEYQFDPERYIVDKLGWQPWGGSQDQPGQRELIAAYTLALQQQFERQKYEAGETYDATIWQSGQVIQNWIRAEAGHTVGKTKVVSGLVSHFFDCFPPAIVYCFAPGYDQINDLLFKEIRTDRMGAGLPGRVLETPEIKYRGNHFVKGRATNNAHGRGTERVQGQHGLFLMFVLDEAEGIPDFVFNAIDSMASGGIVIVLMLANPRTRTSRFHKLAARTNVASLRISCLFHPNVIQGREVVPGAVRRDYVETMLADHCEIVPAHDPDSHTFEIPWRPGVIYRPDPEFMFRVLGLAPANSSHNTFVPTGRYEAAVQRGKVASSARTDEYFKARMGVDVARWGTDMGTIYLRHNAQVRRVAQLDKQDTYLYYQRIKAEALKLPAEVWSFHIRIDGTGGWGSGVIDLLKRDADLRRRFKDFRVYEVVFNAKPYSPDKYHDLITELYALAGEALSELALINPPDALEADLTERTYDWTTAGRHEVKVLSDKDSFRKEQHRSPDDGDGCVLSTAPDYVLTKQATSGKQHNWMDGE